MTKAPRLLLVDNEVCDILSHRMPLIKAARNNGFEVHVAVPDEPGISQIQNEGFKVNRIVMNRVSTNPVTELKCIWSLAKVYRSISPDLIHHIRLKPVLYGGLVCRLLNIPSVGMLTGLGYLKDGKGIKGGTLRLAARLGLKTAVSKTQLIFQNPADLSGFVQGGLIGEANATLIRGSGVDLGLFKPTPEPLGAPVVLMASRLLWSKGVGEFVQAAQIIRDSGAAARFVLAGRPDTGHPASVPEAALQKWHSAGIVEWVGWSDSIVELVARSHIVCLPSKYGEGIPRILIEAAASARPAVTTDTPGCREIIRHNCNGLLVPPASATALAEALRELIQSPELRKTFGHNGRQIAVSSFSLEQVISETLAVYRRALPEPILDHTYGVA